MRAFLLLIFTFIALTGTGIATAPANYDAANRLYDKGDFKGALSAYNALVDAGQRSANLFYNIGNAAFREGKKGEAFLAYERALALEPSHPEAKANLNFLRKETGARVPALPWYGRALSWPAENEAAWIAAVAFWGLCFCFVPLLWKKPVAVVPAIFCAWALCWTGTVLAWHASRGETWIVTADEAKARIAPADNSQAIAALPMGSHVRLLLERGPWLDVQLPDNSKGWVARDAIQPLKLEE